MPSLAPCDVPGELTTVLAAVICAACVTVAEPLLIPLLRRAPVLPVPGGRHLQQPVHAADVAGAVLAAAERLAAAGHIYDVAGPEPLTFTDSPKTRRSRSATRSVT